VPVVTDEPQQRSPEALIEEARRLQRRRVTRRAALLTAFGLLVALGIGITQLVGGGSSVAASGLPGAPAAGTAPFVRHVKLAIVAYVPGLRPQRRVDELWVPSSSPASYRWVVRLPGKPAVELGAAPMHDKALGAEQLDYLYDASSGTIYRTGAILLPPISTTVVTPSQFFRQMLAHGARIAGTTRIAGRPVYVVIRHQAGDPGTMRAYVDKRTFTPLEAVESDGHGHRTVTTTVFAEDVSATPANLALTSLAARHPHARVVAAPDRIRTLYSVATWSGFIGYMPHALGN
jgi:hypothetical protein